MDSKTDSNVSNKTTNSMETIILLNGPCDSWITGCGYLALLDVPNVVRREARSPIGVLVSFCVTWSSELTLLQRLAKERVHSSAEAEHFCGLLTISA